MHSYYIALYRSLWSMRNYIHIMLCVSLFMAQLVFIIGIDKIENKVLLLYASVIKPHNYTFVIVMFYRHFFNFREFALQ